MGVIGKVDFNIVTPVPTPAPGLPPLPTLPLPIYIRSNGSIDPSTAPIQRTGDTYILTNNITNRTLEVQKDNVTIDGAGFTLTQAPINTSGMIPIGWYPEVTLSGRSNVTVKNMKIQNCVTGIKFESSSNITVTANTITGSSDVAIFSANSKNSEISKNEVTDNEFGLHILDSTNISIFENNITKNRWGIRLNAYSFYPPKLEPGATSSCAYIDIIGNDLTRNTFTGISMVGSFYTRIEYNTLDDISLFPSYYNIIYHNNFLSPRVGTNGDGAGGGGNTWIWDSGSEGNYWSDYLVRYPSATEIANSTVGNMPYELDTNNIDHYPLMKEISIKPPFGSCSFNLLCLHQALQQLLHLHLQSQSFLHSLSFHS